MPVYRCPSYSLKSLYETAGSLFGSFVDRFAELDCAMVTPVLLCTGANERPLDTGKLQACDDCESKRASQAGTASHSKSANQCTFRHSSRNRPLNDSIVALS